MRKTDSQKGITLIALIITIIVLLILAVVAIGAVQNDGIINHAKNARDRYENAKDDENKILESYLNQINSSMGNSAVTNPDDTFEEITFTVVASDGSEQVNNTYTAEKGMSWEEWVQSDYNSAKSILGKFYLNDAQVSIKVLNTATGQEKLVYKADFRWSPIDKSSEIIENGQYMASN